METFKRTPMNVVKNAAYTIFSPIALTVVVYVGLSVLTKLDESMLMMVSGGAGILVFLGMAYSLLFSEAIQIDVNDTALYYYKNKKLKGTYPFSDYVFGYRQVQQGSTTDTIDLRVLNIDTREETILNCEPLGPSQFQRLFTLLESKTQDDTPLVLEAGDNA